VKNLYQTLGVERTATVAEIKKRFRKLTAELHPDRNPDNKKAEERFKEVSAAYEVLGDTERRRNYDEFGELSLTQGFDPEKARAFQKAQAGNPFAGRGGTSGGFDDLHFGNMGDARSASFEDLISQLFGNRAGGAPFENDGGFSGQRRSGIRKGADIEGAVTISLRDSLQGTTVPLRIGGQDSGRTLDAKIPAGVANGAKIRFRGQGSPGNPAGDLILSVTVTPGRNLTREGNDLRLRLPVSALEAYRGGPVDVPTPWGPLTLKLAPGSQSGQVLRLRGKGVQVGGAAKGDLLVVLEVRMPAPGDQALLDALERLQTQENVRESLDVLA
jgi:curved DNA-binding protein